MPEPPFRVLQVVHQFLPRYVGGTELYAARVALGLTARGHTCAIFTGGDVAGHTLWEGVPVHSVPGGLRGPRGAVATFRSAFANPEAESAFVALLDQFQPDLVHIHHLVGLSPRLPALAAARGIPVVATLHDYWFECANGQLVTERGQLCNGPIAGLNCAVCGTQRLGVPALAAAAPVLAPVFLARNRRIRSGLDAAARLLAPSDFIARRAAAAGLDAERIHRVRFGIPEAMTPPTAPVERRDSTALRVAYVGSVAPRKGVHVLVNAVLQLARAGRPVQLTVGGGLDDFPDYSARLENMAAQSPAVKLAGRLSPAAVGALLRSSDVLVVPSLWYENAPLVIAEAFAAGLPVAVSRVGALMELVEDGVDGLHFRMDDAADLAATLRRLCDHPGLLRQLRSGVKPPPTMDAHIAELMEHYVAARGGA